MIVIDEEKFLETLRTTVNRLKDSVIKSIEDKDYLLDVSGDLIVLNRLVNMLTIYGKSAVQEEWPELNFSELVKQEQELTGPIEFVVEAPELPPIDDELPTFQPEPIAKKVLRGKLHVVPTATKEPQEAEEEQKITFTGKFSDEGQPIVRNEAGEEYPLPF